MKKRAKTCRRCGNRDGDPEYDDLCEYCESEVIKCMICGTEEDSDYHCRHVFQDQNFEWQGSGNCFVKHPPETVKTALFKLFELMPTGFAADLKKAIHSGKFYTWLIAPLIGSGGLLELHGMPEREGIRGLFGWGDKLIEIGQSDEEERTEQTADGYHWLASLYQRKTKDGNTITVRWINEYLKTHKEAA